MKKIAVIAVLFLAAALFASERISVYLNPMPDYQKMLPKEFLATGRQKNNRYTNELSFRSTYQINTNSGLIALEFFSTVASFHADIDKNLRLIKSDLFFTNKNITNLYSFDHRIAVYNKEKQVLLVDYYMNGRLTEHKEFGYDENSQDDELMGIYLQAMIIKGITNFNFDVILKDRGMKLNSEFNLYKTDNLIGLAAGLPLPPAVTNTFKGRGSVYVYVMGLSGPVSIVFPHKFYYAFQTSPPYRFIGYFGGPSDRILYMLSDN